jgi:4'-phosphopantetheinyl transferase
MSQKPSRFWNSPSENPRAAPDEVHVWRVDLNQPPGVVLTLRQSLAPDELARAKRFVLDKDRRRFIAGRAALRNILSRYLNTEPTLVRFVYNQRGKPQLAPELRYACSDSELCFNLSHSGELALVAVVLGRQVGIDVERLDPTVDRELLARGSFTPREQARLAALPKPLQLSAFFAGWTRKEAFLKACGRGLSIPLDQVEVSSIPGEPPLLLRAESDPAEPGHWSLHDIQVDCDYAAAIVVEGKHLRLQCCEWSLNHAS